MAPPYDTAVVAGLYTANTAAMTLLAMASGGTQAETFSAREEKYNTLVGQLDALAILASARPVPHNQVTETINKLLAHRGSPVADDDTAPPSVHAIKKISATLLKMRDTDRQQGVTATEVQLFRNQVVIYLDQAITYEHFLQR